MNKHVTWKKLTSSAVALTVMASSVSVFGASASEPPVESDYTLVIPATLTVSNAGWNSIGDISAKGTLAAGKKLVVTATSDDEFALVNTSDATQKVGYTINNANGDTAGDAATSWEFDSLSDTAATKSIGIVVDDYSTKPAGTYTDTVTFTAKVEVAIGKVLNFKHNLFGSASGTEEFNNGEKVALGTYGGDPTVYEKTGSQQWTGDPINWGTNDTLNLLAYYPTTNGTSYDSFTLPTDQSTLEKLAAADYMTGRKLSAPSYEDVEMTLEHKLAKVTVNVKSFTGRMDDDEKFINNMTIFSEAEKISDGNPSGSAVEVTPYAQKRISTDDGYMVGSTFTAYVIPSWGDSGAKFVRFYDGIGSTREVKGIPELEAGKAYAYDLIVSRHNAYLLPADEPLTKITSITLADQTVNAGSTFTITPTVEPANATIKYLDWVVEYTTGASRVGSDEKRETREIRAGNTPGTFNVRAYATDGSGVIGECTVTVNAPVNAITLNKTETSIKVGSTETLSVSSVTPNNATNKTVTWSSDNEDVATVNASTGEVTAVAAGTANITATANDGSGVTATCAVTVTPATITVTWNNNDITGTSENSFTKDGVTITADFIDFEDKNFMQGGTFTTTLGNFTKIEVTTGDWNASGTGWSGSMQSGTWTGTPASSVSFSGSIMGMAGMMGDTTKFVFTIEPTN